MKTISQQDLAARLDACLDAASALDSAILVERGGDDRDVVMLSDREYRGLLTTIELLSDPVLAQRLRHSIAEFDAAAPARATAAE